MAQWTDRDIPDQHGRVAVVTGGNAGLGAVAVRQLAAHGATVVLAARRLDAAEATRAAIMRDLPDAQVLVRRLDLASLASVRSFASEVLAEFLHLDLLVNNAGTMRGPYRVSDDGVEQQFAVNHLGHFALTGLLLPALHDVDGSRIVVLSSTEHKGGVLDLEHLTTSEGYDSRRAYQRAKLANTVFGFELDRRLRSAGAKTIAVLAHPGIAKTTLARSGATAVERFVVKYATAAFGQSAEAGTIPELYAATAPDVKGAQFYGPTGRGEAKGPVGLVQATAQAHDAQAGRQLWDVSERLSDVFYLDIARA